MWTKKNRKHCDRAALRYPSDLTEEEWVVVEPHLPPPRLKRTKAPPGRRDNLNAILYVLSTGCQWRALPKDFPPKSTAHDYFAAWQFDGTLTHVLQVRWLQSLREQPRQKCIDTYFPKSKDCLRAYSYQASAPTDGLRQYGPRGSPVRR
jgi:transposase